MNPANVQPIAKALSELFNAQPMTTEETAALIRHCWRVAGIADTCVRCDDDTMVWPHKVDADGAASYRCDNAHTWQCWWSPALLNGTTKVTP